MAERSVTAILRDMDTIEKSGRLNAQQKQHALNALKRELDRATGQLELPDTGAPASTSSAAVKAPK